MASLRSRRRAVVGAVLATGLAIALAVVLSSGSGHRKPAIAPPPSPAPAPPTEQFGANTGLLFNSHLYGAARIAALLEALRQAGATVARSDASWEATEPSPPVDGTHHYDWSFDDTVAGSLAKAGLRWLPVIDYSPPWVQSVPGEDHSPPSMDSDYADYAAALSARYGPGGSFWRAHPELRPLPVDTYEIWNEPDNPAFWKPAPDPAAYAALYQQARDEITAVQPGARVIIGGLTNPGGFLPALLSASPDLREQIDGVAIHPYAQAPRGVLSRVSQARAALGGLGLSTVPLYVTEFGWTTSPPGALDYLPARLRPGYVERTLDGLGHSDCGVAMALLYAWVTPERNRSDSQDWFGIEPPGGGSTADTAAFANGVRTASAPGPSQMPCGSS